MNDVDLVERVRPLLPALRERASLAESERRIPEATVKDFIEAGLLRALQPERFGGLEASPVSFFDAIMEVGTACGSSAWVLGVVGVHDWQLALFPEQAQQDVWSEDPTTQISSSYAPTGRVERVDGGYRISGRWSFSSGCDLCRWVFLGGVVEGEGMLTFLLPRSDYEIDDNWHVMGLRGTGSKDIVVDGAFVPEHRTHSFAEAFAGRSPGQATNPGALYRLPFGSIFAGAITAPSLGVARGAIAEAMRIARTRMSAGDLSKTIEDPVALGRFARSETEVESATHAFTGIWKEMQQIAATEPMVPVAVRARSRSQGAFAVETAVESTLRVFQAAGSRAIFDDNPMQRALRDVIAMRAHFIHNVDKSGTLRTREELGVLGGEYFL